MSLAYGSILEQAGIASSTGSVGNAYDNTLAENVNGSNKNELIHNRPDGPGWTNATDVELATLEWVYWWNISRLHEGLNYKTPAEVEANTIELDQTNLELESNIFV